MSKGTKEDDYAFVEKMAELLEQEQEKDCETCPHKTTCTWYISEHREQLEAIMHEVKQPLYRKSTLKCKLSTNVPYRCANMVM